MSSEVGSAAAPFQAKAQALAPWLQSQLESMLTQRGHAWLLHGPSGLGQFELALACARAWLCESSTGQGACGQCESCHAIDVHTHPDLCALLPETLALDLGYPLDSKTQDDLDVKKRKPSKEIKVDAARDMVSFTQFTRSRGTTKVVVVFPAERMNQITSNTLLKTLEEPPGAVKFILATEAAHQLLPTIRSRCIAHRLVWPDFGQALAWLQTQTVASVGGAKGQTAPAAAHADLQTVLVSAGGRPADALQWLQAAPASELAQAWEALPAAMRSGNPAALAGWPPSEAIAALQKLCHDTLALHMGASPRYFSRKALGSPDQVFTAGSNGLIALAAWSKELAHSACSAEHPYNPGLMIEHLASRACLALITK
ncbi:MAG: DNA polymerase III subunit delta' [Polaromonas sp.]|nr:DNA polymerase III subunit delta' [Polaromonas sp.]